ncbi:MAG: thioredoxin-dependent thiol peroxidase [Nanoarchaeota archaeon]
MTLKQGITAPTFSLPDQNGKLHKLSDYKGKYLLLYFYPKDDTPGCTTEACTIRDAWTKFKKAKLEVVGISVDSVKSHDKFVKKYELPFTLLADEEKKVVNAYGLWGPKTFMGKLYQGTARSSFLIDPKGKIVKIYEKVKPDEHAEEVLKDLEELKKHG